MLITWDSQTGLRGPKEEVWQHRIHLACTAPIWNPRKAEPLAAEFLTEDGGDASSAQARMIAAESLWLIAVQVCRDQFPQDAIDRGPRFFFTN